MPAAAVALLPDATMACTVPYPSDDGGDEFVFWLRGEAGIWAGGNAAQGWGRADIALPAYHAGVAGDSRAALLLQDEAQIGLFQGGFEPDPNADQFLFDHLMAQSLA